MTTTIQAGYMARVCDNYLKTRQVADSRHPDEAFIRRISAIFAKTGQTSGGEDGEQVSGSANVVRIDVDNMTLEEYRRYISNKISQMPVDQSNRLDTVSVRISDEGFEAMRRNPEYEQWVLDTIKGSFTARDPWSGMCGGKYVMLSFGETPEETRTESWRAGFLNGRESSPLPGKSEEGFWERRAQNRKQLAEQFEEMQERKELNKDWQKGLYFGPSAALKAFQPKGRNGVGM